MHCLNDHRFLYPRQIGPTWQRINMGVNQFIKTMIREFPAEKVHLDTRVREISLLDKKRYSLLTSSGQQIYFDRVVFAVDNQEVLQLLHPKIGLEERGIIQHFKTAQNIAVLHSDSLVRIRSSNPGSLCASIFLSTIGLMLIATPALTECLSILAGT